MFNKELFASLLMKAKDDRTLNEFARDTKISPAHISRLIRSMLATPPSPALLEKIAQNSRNKVTYDELLVAAGYITAEKLYPVPTYSDDALSDIESEIKDDPDFAIIYGAWKEGSKELKDALALVIEMHKFKNKNVEN